MRKYLVLLLCLFFLIGNPAETAILEGTAQQGKVENYRTITAEKDEVETKVKANRQAETGSPKEDGEAENRKEEACQYSPADIDLLARLVHAEAKGEPFRGKVAVAATILNRVRDPRYPDTIPGVIYQYNHGFQYCPVRNGQINLPADEDAFKAVKEALGGNDPTGGALSFFNPSKSSNRWIWSRPCLTRIGNHVFVK